MPQLLTLALLDLTTIRGMLGVVLGVGALIFFHELGHFLAAKWAGVRVEVFSLGFGRRLLGFRRGDTDYRISLLPLGGYVRMLGQADEDPDQPLTDLPDDFRNKPPGKRFVILVAGVVMNLVLAAFGFVAAFGMGVEFSSAEIGRVLPGSAAARADLRAGDVIVRADGNEVLGFQDLQTLVAISAGDVELEVLRDGQPLRLSARPFRAPGDSYARLGVEACTVVAELPEGSPLARAGVRVADPVVSDRVLNISSLESRCAPELRMSDLELARAIQAVQGPVAVTVQRTTHDPEGRPLRRELLPLTVEPTLRPDYALGLELPDQAWVRGLTPGGAAEKAGVRLGDRIVALADREDVGHGSLRDVVQDVGARRGEAPVRLVVERPGAAGARERHELQVSLELQNPATLAAALEPVRDEAERLALRRAVGQWLLGVEYRADVVGAISRLEPAEPGAEPVVLQPGDRVTRVWLSGGLWWSNQAEDLKSPEMIRLLRERKEEPLRIAWLPGGDETQAERTAVIRARPVPGATWADLGYRVAERPVLVHRGPLQALALGLHQTAIQTQRIFLMLRSFITGAVSPRELGGPIMIVNVAYSVATQDSFSKLLHLLAILSVNLAVINILPIPVLDGGHIVFLGIEKLKGKPVSGNVLAMAQYVGLFLILGLMALVFFNDIRRIALQ